MVWPFSGINKGRARLDLAVFDLPLDLAAALHDHALLMLEVQASVSGQSRSWKSVEALTEIVTALRRGVAIKTHDAGFDLKAKNRYRRDLGAAFVKLTGAKWKDLMAKHRGEREAMNPFRLPGGVTRGTFSEDALVAKIESLAALV